MSQSRGSIRDVHADDNGSWTPSSLRRSYSIVKESDDIVSVKLFLQSLESRSLSVDSMGFIKEHLNSEVISTVRDSKGELVPKAILHYFFPVGKKVFCSYSSSWQFFTSRHPTILLNTIEYT